MAKKKTNSEGTLASYWCPPTDVLADGVGEPVACVASTFEFDTAFFETELLPRFLGLKFDHTENELTFLIEREEKLALTNAAVLVEIHKVDPGQTTLRWDQVPIAVPGAQSIQHSKIVLLVWERLVRLIVGSANLTRPGYRRNREVFAALDFYNDNASPPRRPVEDAISLLEQMLSWSRVPEATREGTRDVLSQVRNKLAGWTAMPQDYRPREKPRVSFIATRPALNAEPPTSAFERVAELWGSRSVSEVTVITPFVGQPNGDGDQVVRRLAALPRSRDCVGWLVAPRHASEESDPVVRVALHQTFGKAWHQCFHAHGGGRILAIPPFVKGVDKVQRSLHSKVLSLTGGDQLFLMIGSSNFTPHGMGIGVFNVEANLLFEDVGAEAWSGIDLPLHWNDASAMEDVQWDEQALPAEDCIDHAAMLPRFFFCASYSQVTGELVLTLDRSVPEPVAWEVRLKGVEADELLLFRHTPNSAAEVLTHTFPEQSRSASLSALLVDWTDSEGQSRQARLIVSIKSKDDLVPSVHFRAFGVDAMINCLVFGRSLAEWQERQTNGQAFGIGLSEALNSLRSVDTSGYLLYQVRQFGRAMSGLSERLERVVLHPPAVRYRLFNDPLGPVSLANALTNPSGTDTGGFAALSHEHRLFLLAELLLSVTHSCRRTLQQADKQTRKWLRELVREAIAVLTTQVSKRMELLGPTLPDNMRTYLSVALHAAADLAGPMPTEVNHAR